MSGTHPVARRHIVGVQETTSKGWLGILKLVKEDIEDTYVLNKFQCSGACSFMCYSLWCFLISVGNLIGVTILLTVRCVLFLHKS